MVEGFDVSLVFFVFGSLSLSQSIVRGKSRFGWGIRLNDSDIGVERLTIGYAQVRFSVDIIKWFGFNSGGGCGIAGVAVECLNDKVVAKKCLSTSSVGTTHRVNVEVDWNGGRSREGSCQRRDARNGDSKTKFANEAEVTIGK